MHFNILYCYTKVIVSGRFKIRNCFEIMIQIKNRMHLTQTTIGMWANAVSQGQTLIHKYYYVWFKIHNNNKRFPCTIVCVSCTDFIDFFKQTGSDKPDWHKCSLYLVTRHKYVGITNHKFRFHLYSRTNKEFGDGARSVEFYPHFYTAPANWTLINFSSTLATRLMKTGKNMLS